MCPKCLARELRRVYATETAARLRQRPPIVTYAFGRLSVKTEAWEHGRRVAAASAEERGGG